MDHHGRHATVFHISWAFLSAVRILMPFKASTVSP